METLELLLFLLPAIVTIAMVLKTKNVYKSLGAGIVLAIIIYAISFKANPLRVLYDVFVGLFYDGGFYFWYIFILLFVLLIGLITAVASLSGSAKAFAKWITKYAKTPMLGQFVAYVSGILIFFDDYFNALVVGEVAKPVIDEHKVSRAKLSYIIDSTAAPMVILIPISTWGGYIIGEIGASLESYSFDMSAAEVFTSAIAVQFYALTALIMVGLTIYFKIDLFHMKKFEADALAGNDSSAKEDVLSVESSTNGKAITLPLVILGLLVGTIGGLLWRNGWMFSNDGTSILDMDISEALVIGGIIGLVIALVFAFMNKDVTTKNLAISMKEYSLSVFKEAIVILILAWMLSTLLRGGYLDLGGRISEVLGDNLSGGMLPFIIFVIAGAMAFAMGTSWGTFAIMIPIAVPIAFGVGSEYVVVAIAAAIGGGIFGDHCSPISDTTIMSSTGAGCKLDDHFKSQLPYALIAAFIAGVGFLVYGLTLNLPITYVVLVLLLIVYVIVGKKLAK